MIDHIRDLAIKAGLIAPYGSDHEGLRDFDYRMSAELIVRECARTASMFSVENKRIHPDIDPKDMPLANQMVYHSTCQCVAQEIKERFGVSE